MKSTKIWVGVLLLFAQATFAVTVRIAASRDTAIHEHAGEVSSGKGILVAGRVGPSGNEGRRRTLLAFDVTSSIPAGARVESARVRLRVTKVNTSVSKPMTLHRAAVSWNEGLSVATRGDGDAATPGDATWDLRVFGAVPAAPWQTPGGDFDAATSGMASVGQPGSYELSGEGLARDIDDWVNGALPNHGWFVIGHEALSHSAVLIASREHANTSFRPELIVDYSLHTSFPTNYYAGTTGLSAAALRRALHDIVDDHTVISYSAPSGTTDTSDVMREIDEDPSDSGNILLIYSRHSESKSNFATGPGWNREHLWPQSYGVGSEPARSDLHALRPADETVNSARGNKWFDDAATGDGGYLDPGHAEAVLTKADANSWEPPAEYKGDIARALFYMDVRYEGDNGNEPDLILTDRISTVNTAGANMGRLSTLLRWHFADPVSAEERVRNDRVYQYQNNRNPFIDHPEYVGAVFLDILRVAKVGDSIRLSWPLRYDFGVLAAGDRVTNVVPITIGSPVVVDGENVLVLGAGSGMSFFRLGLR